MTQYYDYYSKGLSFTDASLYSEVLAERGVEAVTEPFQINSVIDTGEVDADGFPILQVTNDGKWYFNVRSSKPLTGTWIGETPATPSRIWAGDEI